MLWGFLSCKISITQRNINIHTSSTIKGREFMGNSGFQAHARFLSRMPGIKSMMGGVTNAEAELEPKGNILCKER